MPHVNTACVSAWHFCPPPFACQRRAADRDCGRAAARGSDGQGTRRPAQKQAACFLKSTAEGLEVGQEGDEAGNVDVCRVQTRQRLRRG